MEWLVLLWLVPATVAPIVLLLGFSGCGGRLALECESDVDCPPGFRCDNGACVEAVVAGGFTPSAPENLAANAISDSEIRLLWASDEPAVTSFQVERAEEGEAFAPISDPTDQTFRDTTVEEGTTYLYQVRAFGGQEPSAPSNQTSATALPRAPSNLTATAVAVDRINLSWTNNSARATRFSLEHRLPPDPGFTELVNLTDTSFQHTVPEGSDHEYRVVALIPFGFQNGAPQEVRSAPSNQTSATALPRAPSNLVATSVAVDRIDLSWTNNSARATRFSLEHRLPPDPGFTELVNLTDTSFQHTVPEGSDHEYRVIALIPVGFQNGVQQEVRSARSETVAARSWALAFSANLDTDQPGLEGSSLVQRITAAQFAAFPVLLGTVGTTVRIRVRGSTAGSLTFDRLYISKVAAAGDVFDSDAADITRVVDVDLGNPALILAANTPVTLPPFSYALDRTQDLLVAFDISAVPGQGNTRSVALPGSVHYFKGTHEAAVANRTAFFTSNDRHYFVERIEVL